MSVQLWRTATGRKAYALLDAAFADPVKVPELQVQLARLGAGAGQAEMREISDVAAMMARLAPPEASRFDPRELRDPFGKWTTGGGAKPTRAEREAAVAKRFPVGTRVSTEIATIGGSHTATGTVVPSKRGFVHIKTDTGDGTVAAEPGKVKVIGPLDPYYNEIPETKGQVRVHAPVPSSGRSRGDDAAILAWRKQHPVAPEITKDEARDEARAVSAEEFQALAREGLNRLGTLNASRQPITGLDRDWDRVKAEAWAEVQKPWGGATINAQTGDPLPQGADKYALTVKPHDMAKVSVPEDAGRERFYAAMDEAKQRYRPELEKGGRHLGVFHDDDLNRIDIDPVLVVDTPHEVETIGSYSHAVGGAYHFKTGNGFWPPYVDPDLGKPAGQAA